LARRTSIALLLLTGFIAFAGSPVFGAYMEHYGILECFDCHDFEGGEYPKPITANLSWVRTVIATPNSGDKDVVYKNETGPNSLADGDEVYDGPCEVCHTQTVYHNNTGDSTFHFDGTRCTVCHDHFPGSGRDWFSPELPGPQSHDTHLHAKKGPKIVDCTDCHDAIEATLFADGKSLSETTICDDCHSPGGAYDGVNDAAVGAKPNWLAGIYEPNGNTLKEDKGDWCKTCHDAGSAVVKGVAAPNVLGDNATYGFDVSGHGRPQINGTCLGCHDPSQKHADHESRTYQADLDNYVEGYRLATDMHIPRFNTYGLEDFQLCFNCHNYDKIFGGLSNFRDESKQKLLHYYHLGDLFKTIYSWDSDWDGEIDSVVSCPACHNIHGSPSPAMARHGELISTPGTTDKVPALDFRWYLEDNVTETSALSESRYGGLLCGVIGDLSFNDVCYGCHETGRVSYDRMPAGVPTLVVNSVSTKDASGNKKSSFASGDPLKYQVKFTISGPADYFVEAEGWAFNKTGKDWATKFSKKTPLSPGTHKWRWERTVPTEAKRGSKAIVRITIRMYDQPKGTLLGEEEKTKKFNIAQ
jgi:hypothetical protein